MFQVRDLSTISPVFLEVPLGDTFVAGSLGETDSDIAAASTSRVELSDCCSLKNCVLPGCVEHAQ